ncbi:MAG: SAM-dependent chlorinase/fluorinase [Treponema sp.]|jgi:S-adenosylmethionine hydrolase|nr:SAM-dependent chlorinase/fluorinase [Treponema sp.]
MGYGEFTAVRRLPGKDLQTPKERRMVKPFICIQSDFDTQGGAPSCMHGIILSVDPELRIYDLSHQIPRFQPWAASWTLSYVMPCWPVGTIFVSVVDPGVGGPRRAAAAKTADGYYIISPDNGSLTHVKSEPGIAEVREIDEKTNRRPGTEQFNTFHGRDIFAYTAARLASGIIGYEQTGPAYPVDTIVSYPLPPPLIIPGCARGIIVSANTHFGTVVSDIRIGGFEQAGFVYGDRTLVEILHEGTVVFKGTVLYHRSFGSVPVGDPVIYNGSTGHIYLSLNQASFVEKYKIGAGSGWQIEFRRS